MKGKKILEGKVYVVKCKMIWKPVLKILENTFKQNLCKPDSNMENHMWSIDRKNGKIIRYHNRPQTDKLQTQQTLDMINIRHNQGLHCLRFVISYANYVQGLSCLVFVCLEFVVSIVCLSDVCNGTINALKVY